MSTHAFFDWWAPLAARAHSFRDPAQLDALLGAKRINWFYDPEKDACRAIMRAGSNTIKPKIRVKDSITEGTVTTIWPLCISEEFSNEPVKYVQADGRQVSSTTFLKLAQYLGGASSQLHYVETRAGVQDPLIDPIFGGSKTLKGGWKIYDLDGTDEPVLGDGAWRGAKTYVDAEFGPVKVGSDITQPLLSPLLIPYGRWVTQICHVEKRAWQRPNGMFEDAWSLWSHMPGRGVVQHYDRIPVLGDVYVGTGDQATRGFLYEFDQSNERPAALVFDESTQRLRLPKDGEAATQAYGDKPIWVQDFLALRNKPITDVLLSAAELL